MSASFKIHLLVLFVSLGRAGPLVAPFAGAGCAFGRKSGRVDAGKEEKRDPQPKERGETQPMEARFLFIFLFTSSENWPKRNR